MPAWDSVAPGGEFTLQALAVWVQALGVPLLVGLPGLGLLLAALGYVTVHILWLTPAVQRGRKVNRAWGEPSSQLLERHDASDFDTRTQDKLAPSAKEDP